MDSSLSALALWGYGAAALLHGLFFLYFFSAWQRTLSGALLWVGVGLGSISAAINWSAVLTGQGWLLQAAAVVDVLWFSVWAGFVVTLITQVSSPAVRYLSILAGCVAALQLIAAIAVATDFGPFGDPRRTAIFASLLASVTLLVMTEQLYRALPDTNRWALKPACIALAAVAMFDLYFYADGFLFGRLEPDVWAIRGLAHGVVLPLFGLAAARTPAWRLRVAVSRELAFHSSALAVSGIYLLLVSAAGYYVRYFGGEWGRALQVALLFAALVLLSTVLLSGAQRARLKVFLNKHFFPYRYDYRVEWLRFTKALSGADGADSSSLGESVIRALGNLVESPGGGLWLRNETGAFVQTARLNAPISEASEPCDSAFSSFLAGREWIFNLQEWRGGVHTEAETTPPKWLSTIDDAWLLVPLVSVDGLAGFVVLLAPRTNLDVNWEVLDLLKTAQRQAASYLTRMLATEALIEARKFEAFNRMSAFVVHDLKNLVAQLALLVKNAERHRHNPEFQQDMLDTIAHVEGKMRSLMQHLQEKASINPRQRIDMATLLERVCHRRRPLGQEIRLYCDDRTTVTAHGDKLERVIGHLVQNALDASEGHGKVQLRLNMAGSKECCVQIADNGCGMTPEFVRNQLFKPFQTTKADGMGIGMFETQQYVHELGGRITVVSDTGSGTTVSVYLPVADPTPTSPKTEERVLLQ